MGPGMEEVIFAMRDEEMKDQVTGEGQERIGR